MVKDQDIETLLNEAVDLSEFSKTATDKFYISFIVDCAGNTWGYKCLKSPDPDVCSAIMEAMRMKVSWTSGKQRGKPVIVKMTLGFELKDGVLRLIKASK